MAKTYYEKLRDPRWQRKRLEIMERDGFACILCGSKGETLNVDHAYYAPKNEPWEYPDDSLTTLCETCHGAVEGSRRSLLGQLAGLDANTILKMASVVQSLRATSHRDKRGPLACLPVSVEPVGSVLDG